MCETAGHLLCTAQLLHHDGGARAGSVIAGGGAGPVSRLHHARGGQSAGLHAPTCAMSAPDIAPQAHPRRNLIKTSAISAHFVPGMHLLDDRLVPGRTQSPPCPCRRLCAALWYRHTQRSVPGVAYTAKSNAKKTQSPYTLYQECVFLYLISGCSGRIA
eukprot:582023-Rhodomonas_salina.1